MWLYSFSTQKKYTLICLSLYIFSKVPSFVLGARNELVTGFLFTIVYYLIRAIINNEENWISKKKILLSILFLPFIISFLGSYNYIRDNEKVKPSSLIDLSLDFFYKQGTTYDTICQGIMFKQKLKNDFNVISYTFGDITDYVFHNTIVVKLFKTKDLGQGNNMDVLKYGNNLAHNISYIVLGKKAYLNGHGRGSSYLLETYIDFNYFGVAIYSFLIGLYLSSIITLVKKNNFLLSMIVFTSLLQIFLIPRYSSFGFMTFILTPHFWIIPFFVISLSLICKKFKQNV